MTRYSAHDKWKAAQREAALRRAVYPKRIKEGRLTVREARYEIDIMLDIAEDYRKQVMDDEKEGTLL